MTTKKKTDTTPPPSEEASRPKTQEHAESPEEIRIRKAMEIAHRKAESGT